MGLRGRYRDGFHLSLLYSLELFYQLEAHHKATIRSWRAIPRKRPEQFFQWVKHCVNILGWPQVTQRSAFLEQLEQQQLGFVAQVLDYSLSTYGCQLPAASGVSATELVPSEDKQQEQFPQARKLAQLIRENLDASWHNAIVNTSASVSGFSPSAQVIGALPPDVTQLYGLLLLGFSRSDVGLRLADFSSFQCFSLLNNLASSLPQRWQPLSHLLKLLSLEQVELIRALSSQQLEAFLALDQDALMTLSLLRSLRKASSQWRQLVEEIRSFDATAAHLQQDLESTRRRWQRNYQLDVAMIGELYQLLAGKRWDLIDRLDDEVMRYIDRGDLSLGLLLKLKTWQGQGFTHSRLLLKEDWDVVKAFLDDQTQLQLVKQERSLLDLRLREIFPASFGLLERHMQEQLEHFLVEDVLHHLEEAKVYSKHIRTELFRLTWR